MLICYGFGSVGPVVDVSIEQVQRTFDVNVYGALRMARAVVPHMATRKKGMIINVSSVSGEMYVPLHYPTPFHLSHPERYSSPRPTPWNGIYCASKAALHSLTSVLQMECRALGIHVVLLAAGSVKSNLADNQAKSFDLPPTSLYQSFLQNMYKRMYTSQEKEAMPTSVFARTIVERVMRKGGGSPPGYICLGGHVLTVRILRWLPRSLMLWLLWRAFSAK